MMLWLLWFWYGWLKWRNQPYIKIWLYPVSFYFPKLRWINLFNIFGGGPCKRISPDPATAEGSQVTSAGTGGPSERLVSRSWRRFSSDGGKAFESEPSRPWAARWDTWENRGCVMRAETNVQNTERTWTTLSRQLEVHTAKKNKKNSESPTNMEGEKGPWKTTFL